MHRTTQRPQLRRQSVLQLGGPVSRAAPWAKASWSAILSEGQAQAVLKQMLQAQMAAQDPLLGRRRLATVLPAAAAAGAAAAEAVLRRRHRQPLERVLRSATPRAVQAAVGLQHWQARQLPLSAVRVVLVTLPVNGPLLRLPAATVPPLHAAC